MNDPFVPPPPPPPPPSLVSAYYLHLQTRAIFLHDDLICNGTCAVTGGSITYWGGGTNGKDSNFEMGATFFLGTSENFQQYLSHISGSW